MLRLLRKSGGVILPIRVRARRVSLTKTPPGNKPAKVILIECAPAVSSYESPTSVTRCNADMTATHSQATPSHTSSPPFSPGSRPRPSSGCWSTGNSSSSWRPCSYHIHSVCTETSPSSRERPVWVRVCPPQVFLGALRGISTFLDSTRLHVHHRLLRPRSRPHGRPIASRIGRKRLLGNAFTRVRGHRRDQLCCESSIA